MQRVLHKCGRREGLFKVAVSYCLALAVPALAIGVVSIAEARSTYKSPRIAVQKSDPDSPLLLLVSIKSQRIRAFDDNGEITSSRISSGKPGFDTPTGVFSILEKKTIHHSNIYEGAPMPHMQRLTWSGIALHAGVVPGYRASHGCIRLPASFARSLFGITDVGGRVIVTPDETSPIPFRHPNLLKPLPAENTPALARFGNTKVAANDASAGMSEFPKLFGVTPALAEAARDPSAFLPNRPRSRAEARLIAATKLKKLQDEQKNAQASKEEASGRVQAAVAEAKALAPKVDAANKVLAGLRQAISAEEKQLALAVAAFEALHAGTPAAGKPNAGATHAGRPDATTGSPATADETELEQDILDASADLDSARADLVRAQLEFATVLGSAASLEKARTNAAEDVGSAVARLQSAQRDLAQYSKEAAQQSKSISIFISMKAERIYIRQGQEPVLEAPIVVEDSTRRYGTHVFTAMRYDQSGDDIEWRLVSAQLPAVQYFSNDDGARGKKKKRSSTPSLPYSEDASIQSASRALESFTIPADILDSVRDRIRPGTSLIISDHELPANENGLGTEFVVLTR